MPAMCLVVTAVGRARKLLLTCPHQKVTPSLAKPHLLCVEDFDPIYKIVGGKSVHTEDNASSNVKAMDKLKPALSGYVGTLFLHVINLIVKSGLKRFKSWLDDFRTAISFLNASNQRIAAYKSYCVAMGVRPRKFGLDMDVRWNSTYLMLKHLLPYKETFGMFLTTQYARKPDDPELLTPTHWYVAAKLLEFLELFYDATVSLSGVYYPTSLTHNAL
ncbi:hypothetical protein U9M48_011343 [Paspalum notatum var. saurae]|uniref:Uncharacterized protein n=1 Tax=Paspalum notatum var. saurae TaxID=547442 RepID=A0AAQ3WHF0_PASNO